MNDPTEALVDALIGLADWLPIDGKSVAEARAALLAHVAQMTHPRVLVVLCEHIERALGLGPFTGWCPSAAHTVGTCRCSGLPRLNANVSLLLAEVASLRARAEEAEESLANLRAATEGWGHMEDAAKMERERDALRVERDDLKALFERIGYEVKAHPALVARLATCEEALRDLPCMFVWQGLREGTMRVACRDFEVEGQPLPAHAWCPACRAVLASSPGSAASHVCGPECAGEEHDAIKRGA